MKKIYIFIPYMTGFGGTETVISNLFSEYEKNRQSEFKMALINIGGLKDSSWLSSVKDRKIIWLNKYKIIRTIEYLFFLPLILYFQTKKVDDNDIVISTNPIMWFLLFEIKKIFSRNFKVVSWYHYSLEEKKIPLLFLNCADEYLAISTGIAKQLSENGIPEDKIKVIFNPVLKKSKVINRTDNGEPVKFVYVGRIMLRGQKNIKDILDVLSSIHGNWSFEIFGTGDINEVQNYANRKGLSSKIYFKGFKKNVWSYIDKADFLLLSSKYEGFPMVLNEAISMGLPVVSYDCPTGPNDIVNERNGFLIRMDDKGSFSEQIQMIVDRKKVMNNIKEIKE